MANAGKFEGEVRFFVRAKWGEPRKAVVVAEANYQVQCEDGTSIFYQPTFLWVR